MASSEIPRKMASKIPPCRSQEVILEAILPGVLLLQYNHYGRKKINAKVDEAATSKDF